MKNILFPSQKTQTSCVSFTGANVSKTFKCVNPRKAAGPGGIPSRVLRACADQLAGVFTDICIQSLSQSVVPTCFKMTTIVAVPKKAKVTELNDYSPIALTSVIMKCFERLVKDHITYTLPYPIWTCSMTAWPCTPPTQSSSFQMTLQW